MMVLSSSGRCLQAGVRDDTLWRVSRIAGATALALAVSTNLAAAAAASAQGATRLLARMIDTVGMCVTAEGCCDFKCAGSCF